MTENPKQYLSRRRKEILEEFFDYLRIPSVSTQPERRTDARRCAEWLAAHCRKIGLETELCETDGNPIVLAHTPKAAGESRKRRPRFLVYGHYDVQPAEPIELWKTDPFEPAIRRGAVWARGASDNKGQHFAHLKGVEAHLKTGTPLPCDIAFVIEGEEEIGSENLVKFLRRNRRRLRCDAVVVSDTGMPAKGLPALTYALRGVAALELFVSGPSRDLHSGIFGGSVENPAMALCRLLAKARAEDGRIAIPGFYDDVRDLSPAERRQMRRLPFDAEAYKRLTGAPALFGEPGFTAWERRTARPTFEINGLTSGYQGPGTKTIIPASASAKVTMRLVPDQEPKKILALASRFLRKEAPKSVRLRLAVGHGAAPYYVDPDSPFCQAALRALKQAFRAEPVLLREGGSIPVVNEFHKQLRAPVLLLGLALPDDNAHAPNEKFDLTNLRAGMELGAALWPELSRAARPAG
ncbi:MAG: dipeptidase [Verrucomicrobia bacterium]|nr:dipeptidase [Verrucomicrobiota bacterium]